MFRFSYLLPPNGFLFLTSTTTVRATVVFFAYAGFVAVANSAEVSEGPQVTAWWWWWGWGLKHQNNGRRSVIMFRGLDWTGS
ncbi:unnamed protein product, partial [Ilex paraguariensis]